MAYSRISPLPPSERARRDNIYDDSDDDDIQIIYETDSNDDSNIYIRERQKTFDSNDIDFGIDTYSLPVKKMLKQHLSNELNKKRRPSIKDLKMKGIMFDTNNVGNIVLDKSSISQKRKKKRTSMFLERELNVQNRIKKKEYIISNNIVPPDYFENSKYAINKQRLNRDIIEEELENKLKKRPKFDKMVSNIYGIL